MDSLPRAQPPSATSNTRTRESAAPPASPAAVRSPEPAVETAQPAERPLDDPPTRQQHEPALCLGMLDYLQSDPVLRSRLWPARPCSPGLRTPPRRALRTPAGRLHRARHLGSILLIGRRHDDGEQVTERVHRGVDLRALPPLRPIVAARDPLVGVDWSVGCRGWLRWGRRGDRRASG